MSGGCSLVIVNNLYVNTILCTVELIYFQTSSFFFFFPGRVQSTPKNYIIHFGERWSFMTYDLFKKKKKGKKMGKIYF